MKRRLFLFIMTLVSLSASAQNYDFLAVAPSGDTLYYKVMDANSVNVVYPQYSNGEYWSGYSKPYGTLIIPSTVSHGGVTYNVTAIGANTFYNCTSLEGVNMPASLTSIGNYAFSGCSMLSQVTIPEGVTSVGAYAFYEASMLGSVTLPNTLLSIGERAFFGVAGITELTIPRNIKQIGNLAFASITSLTTFNYYADSCVYIGATFSTSGSLSWRTISGINSQTQINIGDHVKYIAQYAFYGTPITSITFPNSLKTIDAYAFKNCTNLTTVNWGTGVEEIQYQAFYGCNHLATLDFPSSLKYVEGEAFYGLTQLQSVTLPPSLEVIRDNSFGGCTNLTNLIFNADSCVFNGGSGPSYGPFQQCTHLTTVTFGNNVKHIPGNLLSYCQIVTITIPNSVKTIGRYAFYGTPLQTVNFGNGLEEIMEDAFSGTQLTSVVLPNSLKRIVGFGGCSRLTSITIPHNVEYIGIGAFYGCSNLDTLYFNADSCVAFGTATGSNVLGGPDYTSGSWSQRSAFRGLRYVYIGENVKVIPRMAFKDCKMKSIVIPNSVKHIGAAAFCRCDSLTSITFGNNVDTIEDYAFYYCSGLDSMPLPSSLRYIGEKAFWHMTLQTITIPENVSFIGSSVFDYCLNLNSVRMLPTEVPFLQGLLGHVTGATLLYPTIFVPCNALYDYQHAYLWSSYSSRFHLLEGSYSIRISSSDNTKGTVSYLTTNCESGSVSIEGVPATHYRFASWSDGNTDNPRSLTLTSDTVLTASFEPDTYFITVLTNIDSLGNVLGGGTYFGGDIANICALANGRNHFSHWGDNSTENPATFTVTRDTTITAFFSAPPRDTVVQVSTIEIHDTTIVDNYIHDTTIVDNWIYDTTYIDNYIHDTTIVDNWIFDTTYLWQYDTTYIDNYIHDTTIVDNWIYDTTYLWQYDTTFIDNYIHDTTTITEYVYDTTIVTEYIHDTTTVQLYDTVYVTEYDTVSITIHDTVSITLHDTVTVTEQLTYYSVSVTSANISQGLVAGNGTFPEGTEIEIAAIPVEGFRFAQWNDGSSNNPRTVTVDGNLSFTASFQPAEVAINNAEYGDITVTAAQNMITVSGAAGERIRLFDTLGRQLAVSDRAADIQTFVAPSAGAYLIQVGNRPARKIVVVN